MSTVAALADDAGLDHLGFGEQVSFQTVAGADDLLAAAGVLAVSGRLSSNTAIARLNPTKPMPTKRARRN